MSKVDLTSLEWCELIFKDRNKSYGAYKMRRDLGKRQAAALIIVTVVALVGFTLPRLIRMAMPAQKEEMVEVTRLSTLEEPEIKEETMKKVEPIAPPPPALKSTIKFTAPVIRKDEEVNEDAPSGDTTHRAWGSSVRRREVIWRPAPERSRTRNPLS